MTAISIHIGLNRIDPKHYGDDGALAGCHNDAKAMRALAKSQGFKTTAKPLLDEDATATNVINAITEVAKVLEAGDSFFLTYSGHGSQVEDINSGEEEDNLDETWCLYDRMLLDDELAALWAKFKTGVRVTVLSDSCHSGTVTRAMFRPPGSANTARTRRLPEKLRKKATTDWAGVYRAIQLSTVGKKDFKIKASVILISGCEDEQESLDGDANGLFTGTLLKLWDNGEFKQSCRILRAKLVRLMPTHQRPQYTIIGAPSKDFEAAPALRPAPAAKPSEDRAAPRGRGAATRSDAARAAVARGAVARGGSAIAFVLRELEIMGMNHPQPGTNISTWFADCERVDKDLALPETRTSVFVRLFITKFPGTGLAKGKLVRGVYPTPQDIADLAG